jgi:hypothetical protein
MRYAASTGCLVGFLLAACHDCPDKPDDCVEDSVSITQGIYGQVREADDVIHDNSCPQYAQPVSGYPVWIQDVDGVHVAEDVTDELGAYELVAAAGEYRACVRDYNSNMRCGGMVTMPANGRMRWDILTGVLSTYAGTRAASDCGRER